ncbi:uncharacterized protein LOC113522680 [Galleria mellonella]|uniref:Uncharacterized protein LOC113522680 n=1 Tax=Galleria mellonella TaxID=7137 RepID=A0A6J3BTQ8_GALME|nr:uncharacterized protein LOC113522680 [Galleria mellonella]
MNELLQRHGCANVFSVPEGLKELMSDITREVLREQPEKIFDFIANYLSVLILTREHGILAVRILDDLCDCRPSVSEHLLQIGMERNQAEALSQVIKEEIEEFEPTEGKETIKETLILKKILTRTVLDEDMAAKVWQVARNAYRDFWYRKKLMAQHLKVQPDEPWEVAAEHTLALYKKTKPSFSELTRAAQKIQAAYRGYHVRKNLLRHLKPKLKKSGPKVELLGPPIDVAESREIDLGPVMDIKVREDNVGEMFEKHAGKELGLPYNPIRAIKDDEQFREEQMRPTGSRISKVQSHVSQLKSSKSLAKSDDMSKQSRVDTVAVEPVKIRHLSIAPEPIHIDDIPSAASSESQKIRQQNQKSESRIQMQRISFSELLENITPDTLDLIENVAEEVKDITEDTKVIAEAPVYDATLVDIVQEIPEDIPDDRTDGDGESAPTASIPSSAPETAEATDVEDAEILDTSGEEEGD